VLKFRVLLGRALALGATHLATGHYARIVDGQLRTAVDADKDQTYFLFPLPRAALDKVLFPLGGMTKAEVRAHARRLGLLTADKAESQDVCFLPDGDHARLVREARPELDGAGEIVDEDGRVLGRHDGWFRYTVGQRRGLGVSAPEPLFVVRVEPDTRRVVVAPDARLRHAGLVAERCTWLSPIDGGLDGPVGVRVRHRGPVVPCTVDVDGDRVTARFEGTARAVTPGQSAVFYAGDRVLGGGFIRRALEA
jgi:tRNA-specific 2-thiouridylase